VTSEYCEFALDGVACVFGPEHAVSYHHLSDGRNIDAATGTLATTTTTTAAYAAFLCDGEEFASLPDCGTCGGSGKDTTGTDFEEGS
jgi:hypothetical protein